MNGPGLRSDWRNLCAALVLVLARQIHSSLFSCARGNSLQMGREFEATTPHEPAEGSSFGRMRALGWTSVLLALLQSLCTAVLTISGIRVAIGLTALAAASGIYAPAKGWHQ